MKVAFHTLGCKVNQHDSQELAALFQAHGDEIVPFEAGADVYVINTCAVTKVSEQKSRQTIRKGIAFNPEAIVVVTGCYAQTSPQEIAGLPGVHLVVGMADRPRLVELVTGFGRNFRDLKNDKANVSVSDVTNIKDWVDLPVGVPLERTRAMLKVEDGCDEFCSYCIVPYARGRVRSMPVKQVIRNYSALIQEGFREIVLTGIHLGQYGKDLGIHLNDLLQELLKISGECRIRLGSLEPGDITPELINTVAGSSRICQYLHIPLQSGSNRILKLMNRNYDLGYFSGLTGELRKKNPLIAIGTDLIVGFPGETGEDFESTCNFITRQKFSRIHVFRFSPRAGTPAAGLPEKVTQVIKEERSEIVQKIAADSACQYARQFIGRRVETLFEEKTASGWTGLSGEYLRVNAQSELGLKNSIHSVRVDDVEDDRLFGSVVIGH